MNWMGYTPIRALSVGDAYGDLRDDWDTLTEKEKRWIDIIPWVIVATAAFFLTHTFLLGGTAVHVSSRTEHLVYTPLFSDPPVWLLRDAVFENSDLGALTDDDLFGADNGSDVPYRKMLKATFDGNETYLINGYLQLNCGDRVTVTRIGTGSIKVDVNAVRDVTVTDEVGNAVQFLSGEVDEAGNTTPPLHTSFSFYPHSMLDKHGMTRRDSQPEDTAYTSYVWPMEGQIIPSRAIGIDTVATQGLLLSGTVELLNRRVWGRSNYSVATHELELGDHLVLATSEATEKKRDSIMQGWANPESEQIVEGSSSRAPWKPKYCEDLQPVAESFGLRPAHIIDTDKGFLHIDEEKGMAVSLVSTADFVDIKRYRSTAIRLQSSAIKRLLNDRVFSLGWSAILFAFIAYRKVARAYVMSRGRQARRLASDTRADNTIFDATSTDTQTDSASDTTSTPDTPSPTRSDESTDGGDSTSDQSQ